jgi:hypothetical protein
MLKADGVYYRQGRGCQFAATHHFPIDNVLSLGAHLLRPSLELEDNEPKPSALVCLSVEHNLRAHNSSEPLKIGAEFGYSP